MSADDITFLAIMVSSLCAYLAVAIANARRERADEEAYGRFVDEMLKNRRTQRQERRDE